MKKILLAASLATTLFGAAAQAETLRFGMDGNFPPFTKVSSDGKLSGFDVDIANALCNAMKVTCELVSQDWDGLIPGLNVSKYDAILSSMSITDERKKAVDFTNKYYHTPIWLVTKPGAKADPDAFKGQRIGVLRASTQERFAKDTWGKAGAEIVAYGKLPEAFLDLKSGRLAAVLGDSVVVDADFLKTPAGKGFAKVGPDYTDSRYFGYGAGIAVKKGNKALQERLNKALTQIRQDGAYQKIEKKYFSFNVYGE